MSWWSAALAVAALVVSTVGAAIAYFNMEETRRDGLHQFGRKVGFFAANAYVVCYSLYAIGAFLFRPAPPSRSEILFLIINIFNLVAIGFTALVLVAGKQYRERRERELKWEAKVNTALKLLGQDPGHST